MNRPFKFRHVNEIVGTFTLIAVAMLVAGIYFAGRAQGWFEGSFRIHIVFDSPEGSFGLQQGAEVQVQNTVAGRVGRIYPNEDGHMQTAVSIKNRFKPFITTDSVAKVKLRFAIAGDAFVDISRGTGAMIEDEAIIIGVKDEEILETVQNLISEFEAIAMPMLEEVQAMLVHVNAILTSVEESHGVAGAMVNDPEIKADITRMIANVEQLSGMSVALMDNEVPALLARVDRMAGQVESMLTNEVRQAVAELDPLLIESTLTLRESRRLLEGLQRHWLLRKYVPFEDTSRLAVDRRPAAGIDGKMVADARIRLGEARRAADAPAIARAAYELGVLELLREDHGQALQLLLEAKLALVEDGRPPVAPLLLEARIYLDLGAHGPAESMLDALEGVSRRERSHAETAQIELLRARLRLEQGDLPGAAAALEAARAPVRRADQKVLSAAREDLLADLLERREQWVDAIAARERQITLLREAGLFLELAYALDRKARVQMLAGDAEAAGFTWLRAASSFGEQDAADEVARCRALARQAARAAEHPLLQGAVPAEPGRAGESTETRGE